MLIPYKIPVGVLLLARRVLQLRSEGDAGAVDGRTVAGQTNLGFTCRRVPGEKLNTKRGEFGGKN